MSYLLVCNHQQLRRKVNENETNYLDRLSVSFLLENKALKSSILTWIILSKAHEFADFYTDMQGYGKTKRSSRRNKGMSTLILDHFNNILFIDTNIFTKSYFVRSNYSATFPKGFRLSESGSFIILICYSYVTISFYSTNDKNMFLHNAVF